MDTEDRNFERKKSARQLGLVIEKEKKMTIRKSQETEQRKFDETILSAVVSFHDQLIKRVNSIIAEIFEVSSYVSVNAFKSFDSLAKEIYKKFINEGGLREIKYIDSNPRLYPLIQKDLEQEKYIPAIEAIKYGK
jgi:hypothetical protein